MTIKSIIKYFLYWQIAILLVVTMATYTVPLRPSDIYLGGGITRYLSDPLLYFRSNFDGVHYILISTHGYSYGQQAFFPLYPEIISRFKAIIPNPVITGYLISSVCFIFGLIYFYRLITLDNSAKVAKWTMLALLIFPTSFYFSAVYTESLLFLLVVLAFYYARTRRPWQAVIFAALAGYTKFIGIFLLPALLTEFYLQNSTQSFRTLMVKLAPVLLIPSGLLLYMYFLQQTTGDPLSFYHIQTAFNQQRSIEIILPYQVFWRYLKMIYTVNQTDPLYLTIWLEFSVGLLFFILSAISLFKQRISYALFNLFAFIIPTFTGTLTSLPRYVLVCFPIFILFGRFLESKPKNRFLFFGIFTVLWIVFLSLFSRGYWVA